MPEPAWLAPWREQLRQQWEPLARAQRERHDIARRALTDLQDLQPELDAAGTAWGPYGNELADLDTTLTRELEPALRAARRDAEHARIGQHRRAGRTLDAAEHAVHELRERISAVEQAGQPARKRYEALAARAEQVSELTRLDPLVTYLEDSQRRPLEHLIDAIDHWNDWNHQQPVNPRNLATTLQRLHASRGDHDVRELTEPLAAWLHDRGIDLTPTREINLDLGIDL